MRKINFLTVKNISSKQLTIEDKQSIKITNNETGEYEVISNVIE